MLTDGLEWCDVFIRLSFWRHPFTAEHPLLRHISLNLMKKQIHLHLWTVWGSGHFQHIIIIPGWCFLNGLLNCRLLSYFCSYSFIVTVSFYLPQIREQNLQDKKTAGPQSQLLTGCRGGPVLCPGESGTSVPSHRHNIFCTWRYSSVCDYWIMSFDPREGLYGT